MSFLYLIFFISLFIAVQSRPTPPKALLIDCGAIVPSVIDGRRWLPDADYVSAGIPKVLTTPVLHPVLSTVRTFPLDIGVRRKFCYVVPAFRTGKYLVRTTYFYGGVNGKGSPPVFDQIVDGTVSNIVNTTEDYARGMSSYYEGVFVASGRTMSVCIAANIYTDSDPFISALEFVLLGDSLYNTTDFGKYGLRLVARHNFGYEGPIIKFPDDQYDRYWEPFLGNNPTIEGTRNISTSGFWNLPPSKVFDSKLMTDQAEPMELQWPPVSLPNSTYYISLYFADDLNDSSESSKVFNVSINGIEYYHDLKVTQAGVVVFATRWPLSGLIKITMTPAVGSVVRPLINAGEIFDVLLIGGRTLTRDVIALLGIKDSLHNPPLDWSGDPCLPRQYRWSGVTCSDGSKIRVVALNLTSMDLFGALSPSIANLTALTEIWFGDNNLSGFIPDLRPLRRLEILHLEDNQFTGEVPPSLGEIGSLRELFIQNNNLTGEVPDSLKKKSGLNIRTSGNQFSLPPPSPAT